MKQKKPTTPGQRGMIVEDYSVLTKKEPEKGLILPLKKHAGRTSSGRITIRHKGGGEKQKYRIVDFGEDKINIPATVKAIEYDPNRSAFLMLLLYQDGEKRYQIAPEGIKVGDKVVCQENAPLKTGNRLKLKNIIPGSSIFNIELIPGQGGKIVRSAGSKAQILSREGGYVSISLPSKEVRLISEECFATIGQVSNINKRTEVLGKAGKTRHRGIRPTVRGTAMNPPDHPHGGGEGRTTIGLKHPKTPWGKPALGKKTRKKHKFSNRYIVKRRK
ncbi:MAG TPA: 50S ribosomal protein L2 [Candidatus Pacearchaeota archaeon]|nr:50S ribosomal protein L2 [Candidatus Pacearchaeota archaeon]HOK94042.1 50S ribosomal protein L2 [Candidatus Pacearchaeota archaeon]HPO75113.1 50S ribosomal protein L2 [Candidatus Pacearchaeota archaeon]